MENNINQEEKKVKKKKEKKPLTLKEMIIRRVIFIIVFLIIVVCVTSYFVINKKKTLPENKENQKSQNSKVEQDKVKGKGVIDLENDTYAINDLDIVRYKENYKDMVIEYLQIDGLEDKTIENKINVALKSDPENVIDKALEANKIDKNNFYAGGFFISSFSNTLSIYYTITSFSYNGEDAEEMLIDEFIPENFDLTTGNKIKLRDIFVENTKGKELFNTNFYKEMIPNYTKQELNEDDFYLKVKDYNEIEEAMYELVNAFDSGKDIKFVFDEQKVTLLKEWANIYYEDFIDSVAIYNRYKTQKNIFDGNHKKLKDIPVLTKRGEYEYQVIEQGDNYYIDISLDIPDEKENRSEIAYSSIINYLKGEIELFKKEASESGGRFLVVNCSLNLSAMKNWAESNGMYDDCYSTSYVISKYETTKSLFKSEFYNEIVGIFRHMQRISDGEAYMYDNMFLHYIEDFDNVKTDVKELYIDGAGTIYNSKEDMINRYIFGIED